MKVNEEFIEKWGVALCYWAHRPARTKDSGKFILLKILKEIILTETKLLECALRFASAETIGKDLLDCLKEAFIEAGMEIEVK